MTIGIGTDILRVQRIEQALTRHGERFAKRVLHPQELIDYDNSAAQAVFLAKKFAAKEAISKSLGTGIGERVSWQDMRIAHNDSGAPVVVLSGGALAVAAEKGGSTVLLSLSDERDYVVAFAVLT